MAKSENVYDLKDLPRRMHGTDKTICRASAHLCAEKQGKIVFDAHLYLVDYCFNRRLGRIQKAFSRLNNRNCVRAYEGILVQNKIEHRFRTSKHMSGYPTNKTERTKDKSLTGENLFLSTNHCSILAAA